MNLLTAIINLIIMLFFMIIARLKQQEAEIFNEGFEKLIESLLCCIQMFILGLFKDSHSFI